MGRVRPTTTTTPPPPRTDSLLQPLALPPPLPGAIQSYDLPSASVVPLALEEAPRINHLPQTYIRRAIVPSVHVPDDSRVSRMLRFATQASIPYTYVCCLCNYGGIGGRHGQGDDDDTERTSSSSAKGEVEEKDNQAEKEQQQQQQQLQRQQ